MIEKPTKEWAEKMGRLFGKTPPYGATLRGDGESIHFNTSEIALVRIHLRTKEFYHNERIGSYHKRQKHLAEQEKKLYIYSYRFDVDADKLLNDISPHYDFILRPMPDGGHYDVGLPDLLFVSEIEEIPFLLDFQFYNNIVVEERDKVNFLQLIHTMVKHHFLTRYPVVFTEKLNTVICWLYKRVDEFNDDEKKKFFWYEKEYRFVNQEGVLENVHEHASSIKMGLPESTYFEADSDNTYLPRIKVYCSDESVI